MNVKEIAFVTYSVTDVKRARKFYEDVIGLKTASVFEDHGMAFIEYWIGKENEHCFVIGAGAPNFKPGPTGGIVAFEVEDFVAMIKKLKDSAVPFVMEPQDTGVCKMALVSDPDGNNLMIHERKKA